MEPFRKILAAVDFSECSVVALRHAVMLKQALNAQLDVVHVYDVPTTPSPHVTMTVGELDAALTDFAKQHAQDALEHFVEHNVGPAPDVGRNVCLGSPATTVLEVAAEGAYDLIVMGTHGRTGLSRLLLGGTADKVVQRAPCPVLTVRLPETTT